MKLNTLVLIGITAILSLFTMTIEAKPHQDGFNIYRILLSERGIKKLALSQSQQDQIKAIAEIEKKQLAVFKEKNKSRRALIATLVKADIFDEAKFREQLTVGQSTKVEMAVTKAKNKNKVWNLLTTEQQIKLEKFRKKMRHKMEKCHSKIGK